MIEDEQRAPHWRATSRLAAFMLAVIIAAVAALPIAVGPLNQFTLLGFPLGFYLAAQGAIVALAAAALWFAARQERLDRRYGAAEDM